MLESKDASLESSSGHHPAQSNIKNVGKNSNYKKHPQQFPALAGNLTLWKNTLLLRRRIDNRALLFS